MAETLLEENKPSQSDAFAENVLARVLREFQRQEADNPHTVNRDLLDEGQTVLFQILAKNAPLDLSTTRDGFILLWRKREWQAISTLLMRYLAQPLSDSETAWAYLHLANVIAVSGSAAGAVLAHEAFERWLPGKQPVLSAHWPYYPVDKDTADAVYAGDDVRLLFLGQSGEFTKSYIGVWRNSDYLRKVDAALSEIPPTLLNRPARFYVLRMACSACEYTEDFDHAQRYVQQMHILAAEAENETLKADLQAKALGHEVGLARRKQDEAAGEAAVAELMALLNAAENGDADRAGWVRGERHNFACELVRYHRYDLALPLWKANAASGGQVGGWGWLMYAATLWQVTRHREQTLALLREAYAHDDRDMTALFTERAEFVDVWEDPDFLQAVGGK